ncbi:hypothetical protein OsJ_07064 [Oryza sativa Japonica Group]|uniref:Uncharacterized protein n=1 Tax=Oryza sativa subsp. japonica TaxID=39947 RepID=A3A7S8_ORYSJ|nr:hypothetical protein OsJ_07064 [Oryza sativa Japonica Group]
MAVQSRGPEEGPQVPATGVGEEGCRGGACRTPSTPRHQEEGDGRAPPAFHCHRRQPTIAEKEAKGEVAIPDITSPSNNGGGGGEGDQHRGWLVSMAGVVDEAVEEEGVVELVEAVEEGDAEEGPADKKGADEVGAGGEQEENLPREVVGQRGDDDG